MAWRKFLVDSCPRVGSRWTDGSLAVLALKELPAEKRLEFSGWGRILALKQMEEFHAEASHSGVQSWGLQGGSTCYTWKLGAWELLSDAQHKPHPHLLSSCPGLTSSHWEGVCQSRPRTGLFHPFLCTSERAVERAELPCCSLSGHGKPLMCHAIYSLMH